MNMVQRKFYFPTDMYLRLQRLAQAQKQSITEALRELVAEGLERKQQVGAGSGPQVLLELARKAEREGWSGPTDLSVQHDAYFLQAWEAEEAEKHRQEL